MSKSETLSKHEDMKRQLHEDSAQIKEQIRDELHGVSDQFKMIGSNALLLGTSAAVGYWIVQKVGPWKPKRIGKRRSRLRKAGESILQIFIIYLLSVAREKLVAYLESLEEQEQTPHLNDPKADSE